MKECRIKILPCLQHYMEEQLTPIYNSTGFADSVTDPHADQIMRDLILDWACHLGISDCVTQSVALYSQWMADPTNTGQDLKCYMVLMALGKIKA